MMSRFSTATVAGALFVTFTAIAAAVFWPQASARLNPPQQNLMGLFEFTSAHDLGRFNPEVEKPYQVTLYQRPDEQVECGAPSTVACRYVLFVSVNSKKSPNKTEVFRLQQRGEFMDAQWLKPGTERNPGDEPALALRVRRFTELAQHSNPALDPRFVTIQLQVSESRVKVR